VTERQRRREHTIEWKIYMETDKRRYRELREREKRYISNKNKAIERQR
jgi:hypothetical protein